MLAKEEQGDGPVRPDEQTNVQPGNLPIHGGICSERIYLNVMTNMLYTCDSKHPKDPTSDDEWRAYWAGQRCAYQHCWDLYLSLKLKEYSNDEHPAD